MFDVHFRGNTYLSSKLSHHKTVYNGFWCYRKSRICFQRIQFVPLKVIIQPKQPLHQSTVSIEQNYSIFAVYKLVIYSTNVKCHLHLIKIGIGNLNNNGKFSTILIKLGVSISQDVKSISLRYFHYSCT